MKKGKIFIGSLLGLMAIGWVIIPLYVWASGLHTHIPRGPDSGAFQDTVEVDAGDKFLAAHGEIDTVKGTIWEDAAATELIPTFSAINSAFSSALSGYSLNVTGANLSILTGAGETALHSHANGNGGIANSDTTDSLFIDEQLILDGEFHWSGFSAFKLQDVRDAGDDGFMISDFIKFKDEIFMGMNLSTGGSTGYVYHMNPDTSDFGLFTLEDIPGSGYSVSCFEIFKGELYVGYGWEANEGDIARWGEALGQWSVVYDGTYDTVYDMQVYGDTLYAGMGDDANEGDVLSSVDGDNWQVTLETGEKVVRNLAVWQGKLYASASDNVFGGEGFLWEYDGDTWTSLGSVNGTHDIMSMLGYGRFLYLGMGTGVNEGDLYTWDGNAYNTWSYDSSYDAILDLAIYNDRIIMAMKDASLMGDVRYVNGEQIGQIVGMDPTGTYALEVIQNTLFIGTGDGSDEAAVWKYGSGDNVFQPPPTFGEYGQHFRKKVTFKDSVIFSGPVSLDAPVVYSGPLYSDDIFVGDGDGIVVGHGVKLTDIPSAETQMLGTGIADASIVLGRWSADIGSPTVQFYKSRNATLGAHTVVVTGDDLGYIRAYADDGTEDVESSRIAFDTEGTIGAGNIPGIISFHTLEDGGSPVVQESFRINSTQDLILAADKNIGMGTATFGTNAALVLAFSNGTSPSTSPANAVQIWAADVAGSSELLGRDEAGNVAPITSNVESYPASLEPSTEYPYVAKHTQVYAGVETYVAMHRMAELVQALAHTEGLLVLDKRIIEHLAIPPQDHEAEEAMWLQKSIDDSTTADIRKAFAVAEWDSLDAVRAGKRLAYKKAVARGALILPDTTMPAFPDTHIVIPKHHVPRELPLWIQKKLQ